MDIGLRIKYTRARAEARRWKNKYLNLRQYLSKLPDDDEMIKRLIDMSNDMTLSQEDTMALDAAILKLRSMDGRVDE